MDGALNFREDWCVAREDSFSNTAMRKERRPRAQARRGERTGTRETDDATAYHDNVEGGRELHLQMKAADETVDGS